MRAPRALVGRAAAARSCSRAARWTMSPHVLLAMEGPAMAAGAAGPEGAGGAVGAGGLSPPLDLLAALRPVYAASRVLGLAPLRAVRGAGALPGARVPLEPSPPAMLYSLLVLVATVPPMLVGLGVDLYNYATERQTVRMKNTTSVVATLADLLSLLATAATAVVHGVVRSRRLASLAATLGDADVLLAARVPHGASWLEARNRSLRRRARVLLAASYAHLALMFLFDVLVWESVTGHMPSIYLPTYGLYVLVVTFEMQFVAVMWGVRQRFATLNALLAGVGAAGVAPGTGAGEGGGGGPSPTRRLTLIKRLFSAQQRSLFLRRRRVSDEAVVPAGLRSAGACAGVGVGAGAGSGAAGGHARPRGPSAPGSAARRAVALRRLAALSELHARLCLAVAAFNAAYGLPLLVHVLSLFLHLIITPYFFLLDLLYPVTYGNTDPAFLFLQVCWIVTHVGKLFLVVQPCAAACDEAGQTGVVVSQMLSSNFDLEVKKQLELFALQLVHRQVEISACGFCTVNFSLIASIAGSVTTYLVILIQFQDSDQDKKNAKTD